MRHAGGVAGMHSMPACKCAPAIERALAAAAGGVVRVTCWSRVFSVAERLWQLEHDSVSRLRRCAFFTRSSWFSASTFATCAGSSAALSSPSPGIRLSARPADLPAVSVQVATGRRSWGSKTVSLNVTFKVDG